MNEKKLKAMRAGGEILSEVMTAAIRFVRAGTSLVEIEKLVDSLIREKGGRPSFKMVPNYQWASCINLNEGIVHGVPDQKKISSGDVVSLDMGVFYQGYHTDMAYTFQVPNRASETEKFLEVGKRALNEAIKTVKPGNRIGDISEAIQGVVEGVGYSCVKTLTGHGIGRKLHQAPYIPCFLRGKKEETVEIVPGTALAIEVIYMKGKPDLITGRDGWTMETRDGKMSALFERTIFVRNSKAEVLTPFFWEKNVQ